MNRNAEILKELQDLQSPLAGMPWQAPFAVPDGYFDLLTPSLADGVHAAEATDPETGSLPKAIPFELPDAYFHTLAEDLTRDATSRTIEQGIATPFTTPAGYFDQLPESLSRAALGTDSTKKNSRTIALPFWTRKLKLAAAAVLVLGIGLGTYTYLRPAGAELKAAHELSRVDEAVVDGYVRLHLDEFDAESLESAIAASDADPVSVSALEADEIRDYLLESGELSPTESVLEQL